MFERGSQANKYLHKSNLNEEWTWAPAEWVLNEKSTLLNSELDYRFTC